MSLTETEKIILENTDKEWKYIVRDKSGKIFLHKLLPKKGKNIWWSKDYKGCGFIRLPFESIFETIKWSNKEPLQFRNEKGEFLL